jgi:uncharacterized membrane protein
MSVTTHPAVAEYVTRIQAALADLPAAEVEEIVDDIGQHLSEVAGELGDEVSVEALANRLGTPEQYASELRAAAGYPPASDEPPARPRRFPARVALWGLAIGLLVAFVAGGISGTMKDGNAFGPLLLFTVPLLIAIVLVFSDSAPMSTIVELPEYRAVATAWHRTLGALPDPAAAYLRSLRPAWWLIRIVTLVIAALLAFRRDVHGGFVLPPLLAIAVLLRFGKRARTDRRWSWIISPANAFALGVGLAILGSAWSGPGGYRTVNYVPPNGLWDEGRSVDNIYVFGPDGKPLPEAYLYDQDGRPITLWMNRCHDVYQSVSKFPRPRITYDSTGCHEINGGVPFSVAIPQSIPTTSAPSVPPPPTTTVPPPSK